MQPTKLKYMDDSYLFEDTSTVVEIKPYVDGREAIILDETILYPQGGGQPYDKGTISTDNAEYIVEEVRFLEGLVYHLGKYSKGKLEIGDKVNVKVDKERRMLHSRLQSAGHLVDVAIRNLGYTDLVPTKGFHFPEGPNVEYQGNIPEDKKATLAQDLEIEVNKLVNEGFEVKTMIITKEELPKYCYYITPNIPDHKPVRVVTVYGDLGITCGATHVKNIKEIGHIKIRKIKAGNNEVKVSYEI